MLHGKLALTWAGGDYPWKSAAVIVSLIVGFFVCAAFVLWQWKCTSKPLIPCKSINTKPDCLLIGEQVRIFKSAIVNGACITMSVNGWVFLVQVFYVPLFYQLVYGYSAVKSGALLLPITLTQSILECSLSRFVSSHMAAASSTFSGLIVSWIGRYRVSSLLQ